MSTAEIKVRSILKNRTTEQLVSDFLVTTTNRDPHIPTVRGWIMDELEARNPEAFEAWLDQPMPTDESLILFFC